MTTPSLFAIDLSRGAAFDPAKLQALGPDEAAAVRALDETGRLEGLFMYGDHSGALMLVRAADETTATADARALPYVAAGLLDAKVRQLGAYPPLVQQRREADREVPAWWPTVA